MKTISVDSLSSQSSVYSNCAYRPRQQPTRRFAGNGGAHGTVSVNSWYQMQPDELIEYQNKQQQKQSVNRIIKDRSNNAESTIEEESNSGNIIAQNIPGPSTASTTMKSDSGLLAPRLVAAAMDKQRTQSASRATNIDDDERRAAILKTLHAMTPQQKKELLRRRLGDMAKTLENGTDNTPELQSRERDHLLPQSNSNSSPQRKSTTTTYDGFSICGFKPACAQFLNKPYWMLVVIYATHFAMNFVINGVSRVSHLHLAKRFDITEDLGQIYKWCLYIAMLLTQIPLCFMACKGYHKGRMIGTCVIIYIIGCIFHVLPVFLASDYVSTGADYENICARVSGTNTFSKNHVVWESSKQGQPVNADGYVCETSNVTKFIISFLIARILMGIGCAPFYSTVICYIDDTITDLNTVFFIGIYLAIGYFGDFCGTFITPFINYLPGEPWHENTAQKANIGAWWLGYLISALICMLLTPIYFGFSKHLQQPKKREIETNRTTINRRDQRISNLKVLTDFRVIGLALLMAAENFSYSAIDAHGGTIIHQSIELAKDEAYLLYEISLPLCSIVGTVFGGFIVRQFKLKLRGTLFLILIVLFMSLIANTAYLVRCPSPKIVGLNAEYLTGDELTGIEPKDLKLAANCNDQCECRQAAYEPVCYEPLQLSYYSPCVAGCHTTRFDDTGTRIWSQCDCVTNTIMDIIKSQQYACTTDDDCIDIDTVRGDGTFSVTEGYCRNDCTIWFYIFLTFWFFYAMTTAISSAPERSAILRCCFTKSQKVIAITFQLSVAIILGRWPGPFVLANLINQQCLFWSTKQCGQTDDDTCIRFKDNNFSWAVFLFETMTTGIGLIAACITLYGAGRRPEIQIDQRNADNRKRSNAAKMLSAPSTTTPLSREELLRQLIAKRNAAK